MDSAKKYSGSANWLTVLLVIWLNNYNNNYLIQYVPDLSMLRVDSTSCLPVPVFISVKWSSYNTESNRRGKIRHNQPINPTTTREKESLCRTLQLH